jgi:Domain of unknown function (DUF4209)
VWRKECIDGSVPRATGTDSPYWLDESWRRYLAHLLSDPLGLNLRNEIGHGLIGVVDESRCALLVHAVCHLRLLVISEKDPSEAGAPK